MIPPNGNDITDRKILIMKLSWKMYQGFSVVIALAIALGVLGILSMQSLKNRTVYLSAEYAPELILAGDIRYELAMAGYHMRAYFTSLNEKDYDAGSERLVKVDALFNELRELNRKQSQLKKLAGFVDVLEPNIRQYNDRCILIRNEANVTLAARKRISVSHDRFAGALSALRASFADDLKLEDARFQANPVKENADVLIRRHQRLLGLADIEMKVENLMQRLWLAVSRQDNGATLDAIIAELGDASQKADVLRQDTRQDKNKPLAASLLQSVEELLAEVTTVNAGSREMARLGAERLVAFNTVLAKAAEMTLAGEEGIQSAADLSVAEVTRDLYYLLAGMALTVVLGFGAAFWIVRGISSQIEKVAGRLRATGEGLGHETAAISTASDELAARASSQASSLEETSSALEQVTSMSKQNADNVQRTNKETAAVVRQIADGAVSVSDMTKAMAEIDDSAGKIGQNWVSP